jgi:hypothetical protein
MVYTSSFPSGHSMLSAIVYLTGGAMLALLHERWYVRLYLLGCAGLATLLVGISRVYLVCIGRPMCLRAGPEGPHGQHCAGSSLIDYRRSATWSALIEPNNIGVHCSLSVSPVLTCMFHPLFESDTFSIPRFKLTW